MTSSKQWWRRAVGTAKDKLSIYRTRVVGGRQYDRHPHRRSSELEAAVIRATSHDERSVDYKSAGRIFTWARGSPSSLLLPIMWSVSRRASRTGSWIVALKSLLVAHGLLLCSDDAPPSARVGRLPFDLSEFRDRFADSPGFSTFVSVYFRFLDRRSLFSADIKAPPDDDDFGRLEHLQILLDLLMQIRPYADGMEVGLVLEAMDCAVIEIFEVYSSICSGIAHFLVGMLGPNPGGAQRKEARTKARRRRGAVGMQILRRAAEQNKQLSAYFDLCRSLGVLKAMELPPLESILEKDMDDLERLVLAGSTTERDMETSTVASAMGDEGEGAEEGKEGHFATVIANEWEVFEDEGHTGKEGGQGHFRSSILIGTPEKAWLSSPWTTTVNSGSVGGGSHEIGNLVELF